MMRKILFVLMVFLNSCGSNQERSESNGASEAGMRTKLHGNYLVNELKEENIGGENIVFRFDSIKSQVTGNAGCNRFNAAYIHTDTTITFQPAISTKMYCEGKMQREQEIIGLLPEISEIIQKQEDILLLSAENELLFKLKKTNRSE